MRFGHQFGHHPALARGTSLVEALIALGVVAFGLLALASIQATLRINADIARQRAEATRLAEQELETVRSFVTVGEEGPNAADFDALAAREPRDAKALDSNTGFTIERVVSAHAGPLLRAIDVIVRWHDRYDTERQVVLRDLVVRAAPTLSGLLTSAVRRGAPAMPRGRHPTIPIRANDLGDGRSAFKPLETGPVVWLFDNRTGEIRAVCQVAPAVRAQDLDAASLAGACTDADAQLLSGVIRFNLRGASHDLGNGTSAFKPVVSDAFAWVIDHARPSRIVKRCKAPAAVPATDLTVADLTDCRALDQPLSPFDPDDAQRVLSAQDAVDPRWPALNLAVQLSLASTGHPQPAECYADAPSTSEAAARQAIVAYACIVHANAARGWSGRSTIVPTAFDDGQRSPWAIGPATGAYRVCRYTTAQTDDAEDVDHPAFYARDGVGCGERPGSRSCRLVSGNLVDQNFLVIDGGKICPTDTAPDLVQGDMVNSNTLQHQP